MFTQRAKYEYTRRVVMLPVPIYITALVARVCARTFTLAVSDALLSSMFARKRTEATRWKAMEALQNYVRP